MTQPTYRPLLVELRTDNLPELLDLIVMVAHSGDPDRVKAVRIDEDACCAEIDIIRLI